MIIVHSWVHYTNVEESLDKERVCFPDIQFVLAEGGISGWDA